MTEQEYIEVSNLAKLRHTLSILDGYSPSDVFEDKTIETVLVSLVSLEEKLSKIIDGDLNG